MTVKVDWVFVNIQLEQAGLTQDENLVVRKLLHFIEPILTEDEVKILPDVFMIAIDLLRGHALLVSNQNDEWVDAVPGDISKRDRVRVKPDAYTGRLGTLHNGKTGRVVTLRNGKAGVVYDGASVDSPPQHEIASLQKLV